MTRCGSTARRKGEGGGWLALVLVVGVGLWFILIRPGGGPTGLEPTRPVLADTQYEYRPFEDSSLIAVVRNVGGDGRVKIEVTAYRDPQHTKFIDRWSTVVFLRAGEEQKVSIRLKGFIEGPGGYTRTTATAE